MRNVLSFAYSFDCFLILVTLKIKSSQNEVTKNMMDIFRCMYLNKWISPQQIFFCGENNTHKTTICVFRTYF